MGNVPITLCVACSKQKWATDSLHTNFQCVVVSICASFLVYRMFLFRFRLLTRIETPDSKHVQLVELFYSSTHVSFSCPEFQCCLISWQKVLGLASLMLRITCVSRAKFKERYSVLDGLFAREDQNTPLDLSFRFISLCEVRMQTFDKTVTGI